MSKRDKSSNLLLDEAFHSIELLDTIEELKKELSAKSIELEKIKCLLEKASEFRFDFDRERLKRNPPRLEKKADA